MTKAISWLMAPLALLIGSLAPAYAATLLPDFDATNFMPGTVIDNPYFPLPATHKSILVAHGNDDSGPIEERSEHSYFGTGPEILGIATTTLLDRAFAAGRLVEETYDFFAQDKLGNVWYMGEDVTNYHYDDNGNLIGTDNASSWRAGVNNALPGFIMPANPESGFSYFQEFAAIDGALDEAQIFATGIDVKVAGKMFSDVLVTFESTALNPDARELKYYAPGVGLIRTEEHVDENFANPDLTFNLVQPVPLPAALPLLGIAVCGLWLRARRRGGGASAGIAA